MSRLLKMGELASGKRIRHSILNVLSLQLPAFCIIYPLSNIVIPAINTHLPKPAFCKKFFYFVFHSSFSYAVYQFSHSRNGVWFTLSLSSCLHNWSAWRKPKVIINVALLPDNLVNLPIKPMIEGRLHATIHKIRGYPIMAFFRCF